MKNIPIRHIEDIRKEPGLSGSFSIRDISELLAGKDMVQELHRHDFYYILVLKKGIGQHEIDFKTYEVCNHSVFLMRPGQVHQLTLKAGSSGYLIQFKSDFFYFKNKLSEQLLRRVSHLNFCNLDLDAYSKLDALLAYSFREYSEKLEGFHEVIQSNLNIFFIELVRHRQSKTILPGGNHSYKQDVFDRFSELVEANIAQHKSVSEYAALLNLSTYQLNAITKSVLQRTPSECINESIVLESKRQLLATADQVNQIAYQLGYDDVSYFIRFFKKHTGFSPDAFRQNFK